MAYEDIANLSNLQAGQSQFAGVGGARLADPFMNERTGYQNQLRTLMSDPGSFASSPAYKFAYEQGLGAVNASNAARGRANSGNALKDLMDYGQGKASQLYFPQANLLALLSGATTGSPAAAGLSYTGGINRAQDQQSIGAVSRNLGQQTQQPQKAWWEQEGDRMAAAQNAARQTINNLPSGGYGIPAPYSPYTGAGYLPSGGMDYGSGYTPSANAGTGYMTSDYGTTNFLPNANYAPSAPQSDYGWANYAGGYE